MDKNMSYDLFVSYSRRDNEQGRISQFVDRIKADFAAFSGRPLQVFFDVQEIQGMEDWRHRILQGLRESHLLLTCLSPAYLQSEYCEWEFNEYLKHEIGRAYFGDGVAPIYFIEVPGWADKSFEQQCAAWVAELRRRQPFDLRPWFHVGEESLRDAAVQERMRLLNTQLQDRIIRGERAEKGLGNVDAHNPHFVGRTVELRRLRETMALGKVGVLTAVHGLGGVGKTALAIEYAHVFAHEYGGGRWQVRCEGKEDLRAALVELATPLALEFTEDEKKDTDRQFQRVLTELRKLADAHEPHRCLLLLDNVDKPRLLEPAQTQRLPAADWLHVLATTRLGEANLHGTHRDRAFLPVDELPEADALELIETYQPSGRFGNDFEREAAQEIVRLLDRFTLAVEIAAVYLGQFAGDVTCASFLARLKKEGLAGLDTAAGQTSEGVLHGEKRLAATLTPTLERLTEPEKLALSYAAVLPADHIALPWIRALVAEKFADFGKDAEPGYPDPWKNLLRRLLSFRLLQVTHVVDADGQPLVVRMHRLAQELLNQSHADKGEAFISEVIKYTKARAEFLRDGWVQLERRWEIEPICACARQWMEQERADGAFLTSQFTSPLLGLGQFPEARRLLQRALAIREKSVPPNHPDLATCCNNLALVEVALGNPAEAKRLNQQALAICEESMPSDHPDLATIYSNLALVEQDLGNLAEAKRLNQQALLICEKCLPSDHPDLAKSYNNLATVEQDLGNLAEAKRLNQQALAIKEKSLPSDHPDLATGYSNLARVERDLGNLAEAKRLNQQALAIKEKSLPPDHPSLATDYNNLALVEQDLGNLAEAKLLNQQALTIWEKCLPPDHPDLATGYSNLAAVEQEMGNLAEAKRSLERVLAIGEKFLPPNHPLLATDYNNLATVEQDLGNLAKAKRLNQQALAIWEKSLPPDHPHLATSYNNMAEVERDLGNLAEAKRLNQLALAIKEKSLSPDHPSLATSYSNLATVEKALGNLSESERLFQKAASIRNKTIPPEHSS